MNINVSTQKRTGHLLCEPILAKGLHSIMVVNGGKTLTSIKQLRVVKVGELVDKCRGSVPIPAELGWGENNGTGGVQSTKDSGRWADDFQKGIKGATEG
jgi:hypothetical protein